VTVVHPPAETAVLVPGTQTNWAPPPCVKFCTKRTSGEPSVPAARRMRALTV